MLFSHRLQSMQRAWPALGARADGLDWGHAPRINVSVKPSALFSLADPADVEGSVAGMLARLKPLYRTVVVLGGFLVAVDVVALLAASGLAVGLEQFGQLVEVVGLSVLHRQIAAVVQHEDRDRELTGAPGPAAAME